MIAAVVAQAGHEPAVTYPNASEGLLAAGIILLLGLGAFTMIRSKRKTKGIKGR